MLAHAGPRRRQLLCSRRTPSRTEAAPPRSLHSTLLAPAQSRRCVRRDGSRWTRPRRRRSHLCAGPLWREPTPCTPSGRYVDCTAARSTVARWHRHLAGRREGTVHELARAGTGRISPAASSHTPPPAPRTPFGCCVKLTPPRAPRRLAGAATSPTTERVRPRSRGSQRCVRHPGEEFFGIYYMEKPRVGRCSF
jgi:hypothetical protein